ncbi:serine/threonine protein kinase [Altererythrobacter sp. MF3-039]|uniref:serine/threonine protein kinase n=1 Tax=Altererythrobacter sp. MF3-039 TaxID=3252901 RepID=UPI00390C7460
MSKAYSNKALPSGTILREWRLEDVLGVGGFGIVYRGRGIYFDELVAIKEYFPSAISERDDEATVVPIDSGAEEVHALGLKKFVEEAKLLWNLSTPSRHPNIVSVRSLFEIHGTAYMVMDFEDGVSLTEVLKRGDKLDEAKLREMVLPVASGLERAHRVGVLHRDIKPSNILITASGQPVLIDFGSARFETEGVTSTTVTFHTPPYAAIEQYVKTYEQGPWTDIYALGIVLYRCITGEKPAEVLERMHGEKEQALVEGNWPGYSRAFLAAVDAAMTIKPSDRPQSLPEWLAMFDSEGSDPLGVGGEVDDDDATRIAPMLGSVNEIEPAKPAKEAKSEPSKASKGAADPTQVPDDIDDAEFKMAGDVETSDSLPEPEKLRDSDKKSKPKTETISGLASAADKPDKDGANKGKSEADSVVAAASKKSGGDPNTSEKDGSTRRAAPGAKADGKAKSKLPLLLGGAAALAIVGGLVWALSGTGDPKPQPVVIAEPISHDDGFGPALLQLVALARENDIDAQAIETLENRAERISSLETENLSLFDDPAREADVSFNRLRIADITRASLEELAVGMAQALTGETRALVAVAPWADPRVTNSADEESSELQGLAANLETTLRQARQSIEDLRSAENAEDAVPLAQQVVTDFATYRQAAAAAIEANPKARKPDTNETATASPTSRATPSSSTSTRSPTTSRPATTRSTSTPASNSGISIRDVRSQLDDVSDSTRSRASEVISMARVREPGSGASAAAKEAYRTLQANADAAREYRSYMTELKRSARRADTVAEAQQLLALGRQTSRYVSSIQTSSAAARAVLNRE